MIVEAVVVVVVVDDEVDNDGAVLVEGAATVDDDVDEVVDVTLVVVAPTVGMLASDAINADSVTPPTPLRAAAVVDVVALDALVDVDVEVAVPNKYY